MAFVLAVGGAFVSTPGLAWADESSPGSSQQSTARDDDPAESPSQQADSTGQPTSPGDDEEPPDTEAEEEPVEDEPEESAEPEDDTAEPAAEEPVEVPEVEVVPDPVVPDPEVVPDPVVPATPVVVEDNPVSIQEPAAVDPTPTAAPAAEPTAVDTAALSARSYAPVPGAQVDDAVAVTSAAPPAAGLTALQVNWVPPHVAVNRLVENVTAQVSACLCSVTKGVIAMISSLVGAVSGGTGAPAAPAESPAEWVVVAWVRRQVDSFLQLPPVATFISESRRAGEEAWRRIMGCDQEQILAPGFERTVIAAGLDEPTDFRFSPDGRIFITEKSGAVRVIGADGVLQAAPLVVLPTLSDVGERGVSGIELHPDFDGQNGYLYVAYTSLDNRDVLSRLTMTDGTIEDEEFKLIESSVPTGEIHHGGEIRFGPDGMLYWSVGENGTSTNAQDLRNIHGKVLRMHPITRAALPDNPFYGRNDGTVEQIYAYGLRNPFRFTFTPDGKMLLADVGASAWEELNIVTAGANYGWPTAEGFCGSRCDGLTDPIYVYAHTPPPFRQGAITAAMTFVGDAFGPGYDNTVFIADYSLGWIKQLTFDSGYTQVLSETMFDGNAGTTVRLAQGPDGNLYQLSIYPGVLTKIALSTDRAPIAVVSATPPTGYSPLEVDFSSAGSNDPEGRPLTYRWDFGDGTTSTEANPTKTYTTAEVVSYDVTLIVSAGEKTGQTTTRVTVGSLAPVLDPIVTDAQNGKYNAGDTIDFSVVATDPDPHPVTGVRNDLTYDWTVMFHHADHIHPFRDGITGPGGSITIPRDPHNGPDTYYRISVTVTDRSGLSTTQSVDIRPNLANLTINANNPGAVFTIDGVPYTGSFTQEAVVGVEYKVNAPLTQDIGGQPHVFGGWSDGGANEHVIITPATGDPFTVTYTPAAVLV